ncbi:pentapeptide repeat-containing protein [Streptomyces cyaneofuscatus]|uniref:pentapeptide repeat-containing protein n=1 Tax=Streptomyces cyaneofuscatus TaxID=66883 RepID=UPI00339F0C80
MKKRSPSRRGDRGLRLWPVGSALALTFTAAVLMAAGVFYSGWELLAVQGLKPQRRIDAKTLFDLVTLSFGVVAGAGALVALVVAYRRQRVDEEGARREATRLHTERFTTAVGQLGDESPAVRLGAVHALAGLADDAPDNGLRQTCIDILCAYLQLPFTSDPGGDDANREEHHRYLSLRKVRQTILRLIGDHYRRPQGAHRSWQGYDLDLTGVVIEDDMDFGGVAFTGGSVSFGGAAFTDSEVNFGGAVFSGGVVNFSGATFSGGSVSFERAVFSGDFVLFGGAGFSGGSVSFQRAVFAGRHVSFMAAAFSDGHVFFGGTTFNCGVVNFGGATSSDKPVYVGNILLSESPVSFDGAVFTDSEVNFGGARGPAPGGLLDAINGAVSSRATLPPAWA